MARVFLSGNSAGAVLKSIKGVTRSVRGMYHVCSILPLLDDTTVVIEFFIFQ